MASKENKDAEDFALSETELECNICKIKFSGVQPYEHHINGKRHRKMVLKRRTEKTLEAIKAKETSVLESADGMESLNAEELLGDSLGCTKPFASCAICKKDFSGPESFYTHTVSRSHAKRVQLAKLAKALSTQHMDPKTSVSINEDVDDDLLHNFAECKVCEKAFNNPVSVVQHLNSSSHQRKLLEEQKAEEMNPYSTDSESPLGFKYTCKNCSVSFRDVTTLEQHLASNSHKKQKNRKDILEFLSAYPELKRVPAQNVTVTDPDEASDEKPRYYTFEPQNDFFICRLCGCSFSGPESAKDHVLSKKHAKAAMNKTASKKDDPLSDSESPEATMSNGDVTSSNAKRNSSGESSGVLPNSVSSDAHNDVARKNEEDFEVVF